MLKTTIALALALAASACTRASTTMISPDTAIISGRGTAFDSGAGVVKETLVEAAKTTIAKGYRYFQITGGRDASASGSIYTPGQTYSRGTVAGSATTTGGVTSYSGTGYSSSYTTPGYTTNFVRPGVDVGIKMYRVGQIDPNAPGVFDAEAVLATK